jgi:hypothetical protein
MADARLPATPTPSTLYVHDDLTMPASHRFGPNSPAAKMAVELIAMIQKTGRHVVILDLDRQLAGLLAQRPRLTFAVAVGIGRAGERVAREVHARAGWFPVIRRVEVAREEEAGGGYVLSTLGAGSLVQQLELVRSAASIAVVDDTVFSGLTMRAVLDALPPGALIRTHVFCLRAVKETLVGLAARCPISAGFAAPGRLLDEVSFINASGLVTRGAIRRVGQSPLAFSDRPEWMRAWFGESADEVTALCRSLAETLKETVDSG